MVSTLPVDDLLRNLSIKDLRNQCRARGINPAGNADSLRERIQEDMTKGSDYTIHGAAPEGGWQNAAPAGAPAPEFSRPPSSRSMHGSGAGASQIHFGDYKTDYATQQYGTKGEGRTAGEDICHSHPATPQNEPHKPRGFNSGGGHSQLSFGNYQLPSSQSGRGGLVPVKTEEDVIKEETSININDTIKPLLLKDLRIQLRARGLSPAGSIEDLRQRLADDMMATGNTSLALDVNLLNPYAQGVVPPTPTYNQGMAASGRTPACGHSQMSLGDNSLPSHALAHGQPGAAPWDQAGAGSFRPSSRQIEPPGGRGNQIHFG